MEKSDTFVYYHSPKDIIRHSINSMLESFGYVISSKQVKKFERMNKKQLNNMYNLIRYQTNSENIENDIYLIFGLSLLED